MNNSDKKHEQDVLNALDAEFAERELRHNNCIFHAAIFMEDGINNLQVVTSMLEIV